MTKTNNVTVIINRDKITDKYALGHCYIDLGNGEKNYIGTSLERGWNDNKKRISCIPDGSYTLRLEYSKKFKKKLWEIYNVKNRSECKFHAANYWYQLNGCISLGEKRIDINNDGHLDVTKSKKTMSKFHKMLKNSINVILIIHNL